MYQIGYMSRATHRFSLDELKSLQEQSSTRNQLLGVTGLLVHDSKRFMQVIEGKKDAVQDLMIRIAGDERHDNIAFIADGPLVKRNFDGWALACVGCEDDLTPAALLANVQAIVRNISDIKLMATFIGFAKFAK